MTGKKWLLICTFAMILVIGLGLIIPQDVWNARDAGSTENDLAIIDGNEIEYDGGANYLTFTNDTLVEEPVYIVNDDNETYDIALFYDSSDIANETLYVKYDNDSYDVVYEEWEASEDLGAGAPSTADSADEEGLVARSLEETHKDYAEASTSSSAWMFQSAGYIIVCAIIFALMFARLSNEDIMAGIRKHIYNFISENPGEHLASITKEFNMSSSSARHHLYVLEVSDKIVSHKPGKYKHYYVNQNGYSRFTNGSEYKAVISALRNDTSRGIVKVLDQGNDMNQLMLSQALSIHPSTVNWHAKRLMAADIIRKNRRGKDMIYSLNDEIDIHRMISIIEGTSS